MKRGGEIRDLLEAIVGLQQIGIRIGNIVSSLEGEDRDACDDIANEVCYHIVDASHTVADIVLYLSIESVYDGYDRDIASQ